MRILVTGAAGFIGSFLARELLLAGEDVIGVDNYSDYYSKSAKSFNLDLVRVSAKQNTETYGIKHLGPIYNRLEEFRQRPNQKEPGHFDFYEADIREFDVMEEIFRTQKIDKVMHLAAAAGVQYSLVNPMLYGTTNIDGTLTLLELCARHGVKHFVFASSSSVYGDTLEVPTHEDAHTNSPISTYAATKRMGEILGYTYHHIHGINVICARIFGPIYGPLQRPYGMAAQKFIRQVDHDLPITIYGDGLMQRDSTYVDDEVDGLIACLYAEMEKFPATHKGYEIINIGTGKPVTVKDMAELTIKYMEKGVIEYLDRPVTEVSITHAHTGKASDLLGYNAKIPYESGIQRQIEIYQMMPAWYKDLKI